MKRVFAVAAILLLGLKPITVHAQDSLDGLYSFRFVVQEGFKFKTFEGTDFSLQYHINKSHAIRLGISPEIMKGDVETTEVDLDRSLFEEVTRKAVGVTALFISQIKRNEITLLYWGIGPHVYRYDDQNDRIVTSDGETSEIHYSQPSWAFGAQLVLGCEVFLKKNISLVAEYGLDMMYESLTYSRQSDSRKLESERKMYTLTNQPLRIGISVYI